MAVFADDDVIVHGNAKWARHIDNLLRHLDVGLRWRRIARGMIVQDALSTAYIAENLTENWFATGRSERPLGAVVGGCFQELRCVTFDHTASRWITISHWEACLLLAI
jgi:hypothetical protein